MNDCARMRGIELALVYSVAKTKQNKKKKKQTLTLQLDPVELPLLVIRLGLK